MKRPQKQRAKPLDNHKSIIQGARKFFDFMHKSGVKVRPGLCVHGLSGAAERIKVSKVSGGIKAIYRGTNAQEVFMLYGESEMIKTALDAFSKKFNIKIMEDD